MQTNLYLLEELPRYVGQPIILAKNDLTVSGILYDLTIPSEVSAVVEITDNPEGHSLFSLYVTQDDLSSGLVSVSVYKEVPPINPSALIYIHSCKTVLSESQLATPHAYSQSSGYWVPITGTRKTPVKADDITDFEIISLPTPKMPTIKNTKTKPEAKPLPHPHAETFPQLAKLAEDLGIRAYDDGTVSLGGKRYSRESLLDSPLLKMVGEVNPETINNIFFGKK